MQWTKRLHQFTSAIQFYWNAKTIYQLHSPEAYNIYQGMLKNHHFPKEEQIKKWWKRLSRNHLSIGQNSYGAGSVKSNNTTLSKISRTSSSPDKQSKKIAKLVYHLGLNSLLELGTNLGKTTAYIATLNPSTEIATVEGHPIIFDRAKIFFSSLNLDNITAYNMVFDEFIDSQEKLILQTECFYFDGDHSYESTLRYFKKILNPSRNTVFIFDDIYWSKEMTQAWMEVIDLCGDVLALDFYSFGVVLSNPGKYKKQYLRIIERKYKPFNIGLRP